VFLIGAKNRFRLVVVRPVSDLFSNRMNVFSWRGDVVLIVGVLIVSKGWLHLLHAQYILCKKDNNLFIKATGHRLRLKMELAFGNKSDQQM